jgi:hypothetical protein
MYFPPVSYRWPFTAWDGFTILVTIANGGFVVGLPAWELEESHLEYSASLLQVGTATSADGIFGHVAMSSGHSRNSSLAPVQPQPQVSGLHGIVGHDGVLMVSLQRVPNRFSYSSGQLASVDIRPTMFPATDAATESVEVLEKTCPRDKCPFPSIQAVADSHRRALLAAQQRDSEWTAIVEDDIVPVHPVGRLLTAAGWNRAFDVAWSKLPKEAQFVRLGRCVVKHWVTEEVPSSVGMELQVFADAEDFRITKWTGFNQKYAAGGCTTAYMVRKDIIPHLVSLFPCSCAVDCCFEAWFNEETPRGARGLDFLYNIDTHAPPDVVFNDAFQSASPTTMQFGILRQDFDVLASTQDYNYRS